MLVQLAECRDGHQANLDAIKAEIADLLKSHADDHSGRLETLEAEIRSEMGAGHGELRELTNGHRSAS